MPEEQKKYLIYLVYSLIAGIIFASFLMLGNFKTFREFINKIEQSSFDMRQSLIAKYKNPTKDIVILAVDDTTYEYIMDKYGFWPISRNVWAKTVNVIEQVKPINIIFDMLFLKGNLNDTEGDKAFINEVKKYDNVYLSMNLDNYSETERKPPVLSYKLKLNVKEGTLYDNDFITFKNGRTVMDELAIATKNIGIINVTRDNDGIIRNATPIFKYKEGYYPNLSLKVAMDLLKINEISIKNNRIILDKKHFVPLDSTNRAILNWYGKNGTFKHIPLLDVLKAQENNDMKFLKDNFKNKIVYIGTTATSLSDIKSTPIETSMAGVELHATFLNNVFDNNFIKKVPLGIDFLIAIILSLAIGYYVLKTQSVFKTFAALSLLLGMHATYALFAMLLFNFWVSIVLPFMMITITFALVYCEKYLIKAKDYEQTYKLAVTDGLTQLYNHRYFQEQMIVNLNNYFRYGTVFSLILIDIDFFKKFNDTYGHQSGDCVLKQVASILKRNSRSTDIACRYGGEEMSIILTNTNKKEAIITAQKICATVRNNKFILANGEKTTVTISVGVATSNKNHKKPQDIIEYADKCLYKAKESGRNQVVFDV